MLQRLRVNAAEARAKIIASRNGRHRDLQRKPRWSALSFRKVASSSAELGSGILPGGLVNRWGVIAPASLIFWDGMLIHALATRVGRGRATCVGVADYTYPPA
jgi:hypothetical protein